MTDLDLQFYREVGKRLLALRTAAGLTQEKLAEIIGVESNSVHRYETAQRKMNLFTASKIAQVFSVSIDKLISENKTGIEKEAEVTFHQLSSEDQLFFLRLMNALLNESTSAARASSYQQLLMHK